MQRSIDIASGKQVKSSLDEFNIAADRSTIVDRSLSQHQLAGQINRANAASTEQLLTTKPSLAAPHYVGDITMTPAEGVGIDEPITISAGLSIKQSSVEE